MILWVTRENSVSTSLSLKNVVDKLRSGGHVGNAYVIKL